MNYTLSAVEKRLDFSPFGRKPEANHSKITGNPGDTKPPSTGAVTTLGTLASIVFLVPLLLSGQNIPDRIIHLDPLGDTTIPSDRFVPLSSARLFAEFGRFSNGSGVNHRWDARTGGYLEFARFSGDWSIAIHGTMEVVMDPLNDIEFNPRAIFWEEGLLISKRGPWQGAAFQFGYTHRCKHDIDNFEVFATGGGREQRTLIYSGPFVRLLHRPTEFARIGDAGSLDIAGGFRADYYFHRLDDRIYSGATDNSLSIEDLEASSSLSARLGFSFDASIVGFHLAGALQSSLRSGPETDRGLDLLMSWGEIALDLRNPTGMTFSVFLRAENQRDGGILVTPTPATLLSLGVRGAGVGMW